MENSYTNSIKTAIKNSIELKKIFLDTSLNSFCKAASAIVNSLKNGGRLYIAGNGGSAADAQHMAAELIVKFKKLRAPIPAEALSVDTSVITAIGNDFGFKEIFSRQLEAKANKKDIFLAISTSGNSPNIIAALEKCLELGVTSVLLTGKDGGKAKELANVSIYVPSTETSAIQEIHTLICHCFCSCIEEALFSKTFFYLEKTSELSV